MVQEASILLGLPQVVAITGQNVLHRYYYRKSLRRFDAFLVAMGCVLLAAKIEEKSRHLRDVVFVFHHMYQRRKGVTHMKPLELGGQRYTSWKDELITMERYLLKELGFSLYHILDHPHKYILYYVRLLDGTPVLAQAAWNYLNDSARLDVALRYPAKEVACAAVYMAARKTAFPLPEHPPWWALMTADKHRLLAICRDILALYRLPRLRWMEALGAPTEYLMTHLDD